MLTVDFPEQNKSIACHLSTGFELFVFFDRVSFLLSSWLDVSRDSVREIILFLTDIHIDSISKIPSDTRDVKMICVGETDSSM